MAIKNLRFILLVALSIFLVFGSAALLVLFERISQRLFNRETSRNFRSGNREITLYGPTNSSISTSSGYTDVAVRENYAPTISFLGIAVFALLASCFSAFGAWELMKAEGSARYQRMWTWVVLATNFTVFAASVGILAWASALQARESWNGPGDIYERPRYTRETWICEINRLYPQQDWAGSACGLARATRFLLIPLAIGAVLGMLCGWVAARQRGGGGWLFGGKGRYAGFQTAYELNNQAPMPMPQYRTGAPYAPAMPQAYAPMYTQPQGFQSAFPPGQQPHIPPMAKGSAVSGEHAVFR